jgi:hypothetical protein
MASVWAHMGSLPLHVMGWQGADLEDLEVPRAEGGALIAPAPPRAAAYREPLWVAGEHGGTAIAQGCPPSAEASHVARSQSQPWARACARCPGPETWAWENSTGASHSKPIVPGPGHRSRSYGCRSPKGGAPPPLEHVEVAAARRRLQQGALSPPSCVGSSAGTPTAQSR